MIRSFSPHPNPLPPGERVGHSSPQQRWGVFWHILINRIFGDGLGWLWPVSLDFGLTLHAVDSKGALGGHNNGLTWVISAWHGNA